MIWYDIPQYVCIYIIYIIYTKISTGQFWQDKELLTQLAIPPAAFALRKGCCPAAGVWLEIPVLGFHLTGGASEDFFPHPEQHLRGLITFGNRMYRIQPVNNLALCRMLSPCSMLSWMWTTCWRAWSFEDVWGVLRVHLETMDRFNKDIGELL